MDIKNIQVDNKAKDESKEIQNEKIHAIIYMYTFPNGKRYIGQTHRTLKERQNYHFIGYKGSPALWSAIQKYGYENIQEEILFEGDYTTEELDRLEQICILLFKTNCAQFQDPSYGYNVTLGGNNYTKDTFNKLSEQRKGMKRGHFTEDHKMKLSEAKRGKKLPKEQVEKLARSHWKQVKATNIHNGEEIIFESRKAVCEYFGVKDNTVTNWINRGNIPSKFPHQINNKKNEPWNYRFENYVPTETE